MTQCTRGGGRERTSIDNKYFTLLPPFNTQTSFPSTNDISKVNMKEALIRKLAYVMMEASAKNWFGGFGVFDIL